ncbi:hypothetical protein GCM10010383_33700 [Streptomyces lomondensis]|uniref:Secreted protein n=2 Tax=Streptomyces lomondensis TaxID=68229 RepID=A0ABQ2X5V2_9ACTN|nr:hypothetical protein GCM10010383_33700 [Streptomyces lomondensis]
MTKSGLSTRAWRKNTLRLAARVGSFAASLILVITTPTSAHAATGVLHVNGVWHLDPSGCIQRINKNPRYWPDWDIVNHTDRTVQVILRKIGPCRGEIIWEIVPGGQGGGREYDETYDVWVPTY